MVPSHACTSSQGEELANSRICQSCFQKVMGLIHGSIHSSFGSSCAACCAFFFLDAPFSFPYSFTLHRSFLVLIVRDTLDNNIDISSTMAKNKKKQQVEEPEEEEPQEEEAPATRPEESDHADVDDDDDDDDSSSDEDDDLVLEGVIVRNADVSDSDDTSSEESEDDEEEEDDDKKKDSKKRLPSSSKDDKPAIKKSKDSKGQAATAVVAKKKKKKSKKDGPEIIDVEFTFCDMDDKYTYGMKALLASQSPVYALGAMALSDLMVENISVGTVVSVEGDEEGTVYGFGSILNVATYQEHACIQALKKLCLAKCPDDRKKELETVLSGKTKRPAGFFLHGRMVNMPLEIVHVLHQQLVQDMDWAVENAQGGQDERKSLDFGAFVRIAPTYRMAQSETYKFFDDEIFASHAEFTFEIELPKPFGAEDTPFCSVIVMTKTGHRAAMKDIEQMVDGSGMPAGSR